MTVTVSRPPASSALSIGGAPGAPALTWPSDPVIRTRGRAPLLPVVSTSPRYRSRVNCGSPPGSQMLQNGNTRCRCGSLAGLGDFRAALERLQPAPPVLLLVLLGLGLVGERLE